MPDICDPPLHPNHRSVGHGVLPCGIVLVELQKGLADWQGLSRQRAAGHQALADGSTTLQAQVWHELLALAWRLIAGILAGIPAGYLYNLVLDAISPKGLPLVA